MGSTTPKPETKFDRAKDLVASADERGRIPTSAERRQDLTLDAVEALAEGDAKTAKEKVAQARKAAGALLLTLVLLASMLAALMPRPAAAHGTLLYVETRCLAYVSYYRWGAVNAYQNFWYADGHVYYVAIWVQGCPGS